MTTNTERQGHPFVFEDVEQANMRLNGSIVLYENKPFTVSNIFGPEQFEDGVPRVELQDRAGTVIRKKMNSPKFNRFRPFEVGFINHISNSGRLNCIFTERVPVRRSQQGLTSANFKRSYISPEMANYSDPPSFSNTVWSNGFQEMVDSVYPEFKECLDALSREGSVAFHKKYAIILTESGLFQLYRKRESIGLIRKEGDSSQIYLFPSKAHYRDELMTLEGVPQNIVIW